MPLIIRIMWIDFQAKADVATEFFGDIEKTLKPIGFRKHWAKGLDHTDAGYAMKQFPKMHEFIALMQTIDPKGKFRNNTGESWYNAMGNLIEDMNGNEVEDEKNGIVVISNYLLLIGYHLATSPTF